MIHKQGIKAVSEQHLLRRSGIYYYRRRVPLSLVEKIGKKVIQHSLETSNFKEAKKRRTMYDAQWDVRFEAYSNSGPDDKALVQTSAQNSSLSAAELTQLVRDYVERRDQAAKKRDASCHPVMASERKEMRIEAEFEAQTLQARDDLNHQWIYLAGTEALKAAGKSFNDPDVPGESLAELVRRGLLELNRRHRARLADDHGRSFFDQLFDPARPAMLTFGKLAEQHLRLIEEDGAVNALGAKGLDRQRATIALVREIVGDDTPVDAVDYDACLHVRTILARLPANRTKLYGDLPLAQAIERAAKDGKPLLSPVTQERYLVALRDLLDLAAKKRLILGNPAEGLRPIKRDAISSGDKRKPFTLQQIADFFQSTFYAECTKHSPPYAHDKTAWRFWLPLLCLYLGMRPNEVAQMHVGDLKCTGKGTAYLDVVATADDDEADLAVSAKKTLKTQTSRRRIPLHPELIKIGFLQFVAARKKAGGGPRLFSGLKADKYGNYASYALKRFRETYLPAAIKMEPRQSFYSFRHSWRDALRRIDAQPATL
jgi:integrase